MIVEWSGITVNNCLRSSFIKCFQSEVAPLFFFVFLAAIAFDLLVVILVHVHVFPIDIHTCVYCTGTCTFVDAFRAVLWCVNTIG